MSRRALLILVVLLLPLVVLAAASAPAAGPDPQIARLKQQVRNLNGKVSDQQDTIDSQVSIISDQSDTIARLRGRIANWPDPVDAINAGSPDDQWAAMVAIWRAFPTLDPGQLCGYDKGNVPGDGDGLTLTSWTFYRWSGC